MKTKKQLEKEGWSFITLDGGAIHCEKKNTPTYFRALTILTIRRQIAAYEAMVAKTEKEVEEYLSN